MKLIFAYGIGKGKPVSDSCSNQEIIAAMSSSGDIIVLIADNFQKQYFIERVINKFAIDLYVSTNFKQIEDENEWNQYVDFLLNQELLPEIFSNAR